MSLKQRVCVECFKFERRMSYERTTKTLVCQLRTNFLFQPSGLASQMFRSSQNFNFIFFSQEFRGSEASLSWFNLIHFLLERPEQLFIYILQ